MNDVLQQKLKTLPRSAGVYFHKDSAGEIIYVGKAAVLKNRVRQYFQSSRDMDVKTQALVSEIHDTDWVETESEIDALFLESEMVKRYMPRYNILLRDDKSQMYVRVDMKSEWPHVDFTRNPVDDGAEYYGPYYNGYALKKALRYLRKTFPYYTKEPKRNERASLDAHIGLEPYGLTSDEYKTELRKLISYIKGSRVQLVRELERDMKQAAQRHDFEGAALLRNKLQNLQELQRRIMFGDKEFLDISKDKALVQLRNLLMLDAVPARIEGFDISHKSGQDVVASQVVFINGVSSRSDYRKYKMTQQKNDDYANMYEVVYRRLSPRNLASWGAPDFLLIDGGKGQLDAAIRAAEERNVQLPIVSIAKREEEMYVHSTRSNVKDTQLMSFITSPPRGVYVEREGEYYIINLHSDQRNAGGHSRNLRGNTVSVYSDLVKLFQRIRDESHRFAVSYHSTLSRKRQTISVLEEISGIGPATRRKLLKEFGSVRGIASASDRELQEVIGVERTKNLRQVLLPQNMEGE
jgi:excinuclease ABC subunit C